MGKNVRNVIAERPGGQAFINAYRQGHLGSAVIVGV